jgi:hypothetical protein
VPRAFEDWYLVEDFTALGALEQAAVRGRALEPHDRAAGMALGGAGGLYGLLRQGENPAPDRAAWFGKPPGVRYPDFLAEVREGELWQRKLVLGPAPEFCLTGGTPPVEAVQPIVLGVETIPPGE